MIASYDTTVYNVLRGSKMAEAGDLPAGADVIGVAVLESLPHWRDRWAPGEHSGRRWQYTWAAVNAGMPRAPHTAPRPKVLDAGADNVSLQYYYARRDCHVTSLDCDPAAIGRAVRAADAQHLTDRMLFLQHDLLTPLAQTYERVLCLSVLEHIEDWQRVARWLAKATAVGGLLVLTVDVAMPGATLPYFTPATLRELRDIVEDDRCELVGGRGAFDDYPTEPLVRLCGRQYDQPLTWAGLAFRRLRA